jgi:hypothetical protein
MTVARVKSGSSAPPPLGGTSVRQIPNSVLRLLRTNPSNEALTDTDERTLGTTLTPTVLE